MGLKAGEMGQGVTIWLTGLSGAGKTTIARRLETIIAAEGRRVEVLDGDEVRQHLSKGLGFSREDRDTNVARIAYVADLLTRNGVVTIVAAISPYQRAREAARHRIGSFIEVYITCRIEELQRRDTKGLYARALRGELPQFTGISDPYEPPPTPEITVATDVHDQDASVGQIVGYLRATGWLPARDERA